MFFLRDNAGIAFQRALVFGAKLGNGRIEKMTPLLGPLLTKSRCPGSKSTVQNCEASSPFLRMGTPFKRMLLRASEKSESSNVCSLPNA